MFPLQWGADTGMVPPQSVQCSLLDEPSPLGLRLRKSPSLLDLIQMKLSQGNSATGSCVTSTGGSEAGKKKDLKSTAMSGTTDKLKASNFPASLLRIGSWEVTAFSILMQFYLLIFWILATCYFVDIPTRLFHSMSIQFHTCNCSFNPKDVLSSYS